MKRVSVEERGRDRRYHVSSATRCNNHCVFCLEGHHAGTDLELHRKVLRYDFLTPAKLSSYLDKLRDLAVPLLFTAGEPTINPHLPELVALARARGHATIALQTNGRMLAYKAFTRRLVEEGVTEFSISVHGSRPEVHDAATRVQVSFAQTMAGLANVLRLKERFRLRVATSTTLSRINRGDVENLLRLLLGWRGIDAIALNPLVLQGNALRSAEKLLLPYSEVVGAFRSAAAKLRREKAAGLEKVSLTDMPRCLLRRLEEFAGFFETVLYVEPDGSVAAPGPKIFFPGVKREACRSCRHFRSCTGIDPGYIRRFGWREFIPAS